MRILVTDDHPLALQGLSLTLKSASHEVHSVDSNIKTTEALKDSFDLLLLDYHLNEDNALNLLASQDVRFPEKILIISGITDPDDIIYCLETTPACAFFSKQCDLNELLEAIDLLCAGNYNKSKAWIWCSNSRNYILPEDAFPNESLLTSKEREVLMLLRKGLQDKQIADTLNRSIHTIRVQIRSIKRKRSIIRRNV